MIKNNSIKSKRGFTIIEVVLVLAIAGLIFLMVFIALPALQRSQRDTQRRNDMARFAAQLAQYQANNNGKLPNTKTKYNQFIENYLQGKNKDEFVDPSGVNYTVQAVNDCNETNGCDAKSTAGDYDKGRIYVYLNATCNGETPKKQAGSKYVAFTYKLEGAGVYCGHS